MCWVRTKRHYCYYEYFVQRRCCVLSGGRLKKARQRGKVHQSSQSMHRKMGEEKAGCFLLPLLLQDETRSGEEQKLERKEWREKTCRSAGSLVQKSGNE